jgi:hypothetical protein
MIKKIVARPLILVSVMALAIMAAAFCAISIPTHAAPAHIDSQAVPAGQSNISQNPSTGKPPHYSPKTLSCVHQAGKTCISIKNTTKAPQTVTQKGKALYTLAPGQLQPVVYTSAGTYTYGLASNPKATLTVTVT